ncbi:MAG: hypothetical protein A2W91_12435 [Bacteroidetes bacterium GWF2_38_335]|nr:MAG: hypothetical protein A2W91_12435 [Bacteroidetes bacterium GWF2_38_335]OFY76976.1 MAG: hypothetical protein A2281_00550 [Bacteroidetes bacterium RIFOXYA12_FULL_38_20]HBS86831.1 hypothetical protein [Bacteroidales bacterium]
MGKMRTFFYIAILILAIITGCNSSDDSSGKNNSTEETDSVPAEIRVIIADNQDSLFSFIENSRENDTIIIVDKIETNKPLIIKNKKNLVIKGDFGLLTCRECKDQIILIDSSENITIENMGISGENMDTLITALIKINSSRKIKIFKNNLGTNTEYAIRISKNCDSLNISENNIHDCNNTGIEVLAASTTIQKNVFFNNGNGKNDILFGKKIEELCVSEENEFRIVDHSEYIVEIDKNIKQKTLTEKQSIAPDGIENISGFYEGEELVCIKYVYSEEDEQSVSVYLMKSVPLYIVSENIVYSESSEKKTTKDQFYLLKGTIVKWEQFTDESPKTMLIEDNKLISKKQKELKNFISYYIHALDKLIDQN